MDQALKNLNKSIRDARKGNKGLQEAFKAIGVSMAELNDPAVSTTDIFDKMSDAVHDATDETHKQAIAATLLGKTVGIEMLPVLGEGTEKQREFGNELARTGALMTTDLAEKSKKFGDIMTRVNAPQGSHWRSSKLMPR